MLKQKYFFCKRLVSICSILLCLTIGAFAQEAIPDSVKEQRKKYAGKNTWEHIVSFPATVISTPLILLSNGAEAFVGYAYDTKLIPRIRNVFVSTIGNRAISPKYSSRTGFGLKFSKRVILSENDEFSLTASGNLDKRQRYRIRWKDIQLGNSPLFLDARARYRFLPDEDFFGIGPKTKESNEIDYDHEYTTGDIALRYQLSQKVSFKTLVRYDHNNIYNIISENDQPVGLLQTDSKIMQYHAETSIDTRNRRGNPTSGQVAMFGATLFRDVDEAEQYNFHKFMADVSHHIHFGYNRVLRLRLAAETTTAEDGSTVPFYYLSELGREETIRGFDRGRFRDLDRFISSAEYRIPLWRKLDFFGFVDAGQVMNNIYEDIALKDLWLGYGAGFHFYSAEDLLATFQVAFSKERVRVYFRLY